MDKRIITMNVLPGEPIDGSGRVCIHLFVRDERGPFTEPHVLHPGRENPKELEAKPTRGRLACDRMRRVAPVRRGNVTIVTPRTDDPRAVTCPKCLASEECKVMLAKLEAAAEAAK